ncbi:hypothetical protein Ssi03_74740 [Sphaerisporangium siamense]|uniref:Uncharacterized protein n=1 Tax=Sphaerisporangium siamense TaxID=795645 RepID=A0A7W7D8R7_9ACTN|nr:hypothetical protein [Sphaerisporangium siamense]MBB4702327.1 hypothetical protein [Sphaerisporangium siamense]GII89484.1 hypothetical protein Ssi03_74740 [Sphaerisporangium siamense]
MSGYSYTTISMHPGQSPRVGVSIYPDQHASVHYYPAGNDPHAFIGIDHCDAHVTIGTTQDTVITDAHVTFARSLFEAAARFLADCERLRDQHADKTDTTDQGDPVDLVTDQTAPGKAA